MQRWILVKQEVSGEQVGVGHECGWSKRGVWTLGVLGAGVQGSDGSRRRVPPACVGKPVHTRTSGEILMLRGLG